MQIRMSLLTRARPSRVGMGTRSRRSFSTYPCVLLGTLPGPTHLCPGRSLQAQHPARLVIATAVRSLPASHGNTHQVTGALAIAELFVL
jgi:hypothetical protein